MDDCLGGALMKRIILLIIITAVVLAAFAFPAMGAVNLYRIAVLPFDDGSIKKNWGEKYELGQGVADELVTALLGTERFRIIEREIVDKVLEEQNLGRDGVIDPQTAAKIGKILGVQYLVIGRITDFSTKEDDDILANPNHNNPMGMRITKSTSRVSIDARMVDATTAEILTSVTGTGKKATVNLGLITKEGGISFGDKNFEKSDLGKAFRQAANSTARQLATKAYQETVLTISGMIAYVSADRIVINVGRKDGVEMGMVFKVARKLATLTDPDTGQIIGEATEPVAEITVIEVKEKSASCKIVTRLTNDYEIAVSDLIETKTPVKLVLPELPPLEEEDEEGPRKGKEFRLYAERMVFGEYTDETFPKDDEVQNSVINFIGGQAVFNRFKFVAEGSFDGEIKEPARKIDISEYKLGYNLNPVQDVQIELFVSKFNLGVESGGNELLHCSSWIFGTDVEYEMAEKIYFELSYGYGASIDFRVNGTDKAGGNLATLKTKISYYFSEHASVYAEYRSYLMKIGDERDLTGITIGMGLKY